MLLAHGYNTFALGKWHLTPVEQTSAAGPYDRWPLGRGFERYYGFLGADTNQYYPDLVADNHRVEPPRTPEEDYHLTPDLVDHAISFIADTKQVAPDKPFFMYFCTGAMHAPHQVPKQWADKYKGKFDDGWDAYREKVFKKQKQLGLLPLNTRLSPRDPDVRAWESLSDDERRVAARMMEVFAGFLEHTDHHIGRLLDFLESTGQLDNTLIMLVSDNGASAEGWPARLDQREPVLQQRPGAARGQSQGAGRARRAEVLQPLSVGLGLGWQHAVPALEARDLPRRCRGPVHRNWPDRIAAKGKIRSQYAHLIDVIPTVLDALGIDEPQQLRGVAQSPLQGVSFAHTFDDRDPPTRHLTQYFEIAGHRSNYHEGWRAVCPVPGPSFTEAGMGFGQMVVDEVKLRELDASGWELYHVAEDPTETENLATQNRPKLIEMIATWYTEAGRYNVLPIDSRGTARFEEQRPQLTPDRTHYVFYPGTSLVPESIAPRVLNRPHSITAAVELEDGDADRARRRGGWLLALRQGPEAALRLQLSQRAAV
jgi:arylsulfatase A-like enzyme